LSDGIEYKDLAEVFPEVLTVFLDETDQTPDDEDVMKMFVHLNVQALQRNSKPEGYNRKGRMRLIFPLGAKQFYIKSNNASSEVVRLGEKLSKLLNRAGIGHTLEWNALSTAK